MMSDRISRFPPAPGVTQPWTEGAMCCLSEPHFEPPGARPACPVVWEEGERNPLLPNCAAGRFFLPSKTFG